MGHIRGDGWRGGPQDQATQGGVARRGGRRHPGPVCESPLGFLLYPRRPQTAPGFELVYVYVLVVSKVMVFGLPGLPLADIPAMARGLPVP